VTAERQRDRKTEAAHDHKAHEQRNGRIHIAMQRPVRLGGYLLGWLAPTINHDARGSIERPRTGIVRLATLDPGIEPFAQIGSPSAML
jgi:hypothetical protein